MAAMVALGQERQVDVMRKSIDLQVNKTRRNMSIIETEMTNLDDRASSAEHQIKWLRKRLELMKLEAELMELEAKLKRLEGKLTWKDWLIEPLPLIKFQFASATGLHGHHMQFHPSTVKVWESFELEVAEHVKSHIDEALKSSDEFVIPCMEVGSVMEVIINLRTFFAAFFKYKPFDKFSCLLHHRSKSFGMDRDCIIEPAKFPIASPEFHALDIAHGRTSPNIKMCNQAGKTFLVIECQPPAVFRNSVSEPVPDLVSPSRPALNETLRLVTKYMVSEKVAHAVLTSLDISFFIKFVKNGEGDHLLISRGITSDARGTPLLAAFDYIMCSMADETDITLDGHRYNGDLPVSSFADDMPQSSNERFRSPRRQDKDEESSHDRPSKRTRSQATSGGGGDVQASSLHLHKTVFATGWSGNLVLGEIRGQRVVIKMAPYHTERAHVLLHEATMYLTLKDCWGRYIPKLVDHGTTVRETLVYLAIEYVDGLELGRDLVTKEVASAAREALSAIHSCGILHGDLHGGSIMVVKGGVRFIDFGSAKSFRRDKECKRELHQLQKIICGLGERKHHACQERCALH